MAAFIVKQKAKGSPKSGSRRGKKDFSLDIDVPFLGKAKFSSKKGMPARKQVSAPIAKGLKARSMGPKVSSFGSGERIVGSGCFLTLPDDQSNSIGDLGLSAPINPGLKQFFPWLSNTAAIFSKYRFNKLCFTFVPRVSTITVGDIILMGDPNVQNELPHSFSTAIAFEGSVYGNIWASHSFMAEQFCHKDLFVRTQQLTINEDSKTYDSGVFGYLTSGYQAIVSAGSPGYITVDYDVTFFDRRLPPNPGCFITVDNIIFDASNPAVATPLTHLWTIPNPSSLVQVWQNTGGGTSFLGFPQGLWICMFTYCPRDGTSSPVGLRVGYELLGGNTNDVILVDTNALQRTSPYGDFELGSSSFMRSGAMGVGLGNSGQASAFWALEATADAVPPLMDIDAANPPPGWFAINSFSASASELLEIPVMTTNMICRMSPDYASYLGFTDGIPVIAPRRTSEVRRLGRHTRAHIRPTYRDILKKDMPKQFEPEFRKK